MIKPHGMDVGNYLRRAKLDELRGRPPHTRLPNGLMGPGTSPCCEFFTGKLEMLKPFLSFILRWDPKVPWLVAGEGILCSLSPR